MIHPEVYEKSILLIGPCGVGKSTIAEELEGITGMKRFCLDRIANEDWNKNYAKSFPDAEHYNCHMIQRELGKLDENTKPFIVDFGAGHSVYENREIFNKVKRLLTPFKNIVLLLPSTNPETSLKIMEERTQKRNDGDHIEENRKFLSSSCNMELATVVIFENGKTPEEIAEDILKAIEIPELETEEMEK